MTTQSTLSICKPWLLIAVVAFFAVAIPYSLVNQPGGPMTEVVGVIESSGSVPSKVSPPRYLATVRLKDGSLIQASVVVGCVALRGQVAHVRVMHRVVSGAEVYEVFCKEAIP